MLGWALGWGTREMFVIAGIIGTSSTAIVTKLLLDLRRLANPETGMILGIIVVEDVFLAFYLALLQPILGHQEGAAEILALDRAAFAFLLGLFALARWGGRVIRPIISAGDAALDDDPARRLRRLRRRLRAHGRRLGRRRRAAGRMVVAGTGIGPRVERLIVPLRDTFAAIFFFWFGLTIAPSALGAIALPVAIAVRRHARSSTSSPASSPRGCTATGAPAAANTALMLVSRGEF